MSSSVRVRKGFKKIVEQAAIDLELDYKFESFGDHYYITFKCDISENVTISRLLRDEQKADL